MILWLLYGCGRAVGVGATGASTVSDTAHLSETETGAESETGSDSDPPTETGAAPSGPRVRPRARARRAVAGVAAVPRGAPVDRERPRRAALVAARR